MQAVDIHALDVDIAHAGMDQRKVHMLAREVFPKLKWKPFVALHNALLPGLAEPEKAEGAEKEEATAAMKMSKSKPWTAIFIHDSKKEIEEKLAKAYCPPRVAENNPVLEFARQLAFHEFEELRVERPAKFGGDVSYASYANLEKDFVEGKLHPMDLKKSVAEAVDKIIAPVRAHFEKPEFKKLLEVYKKVEVTR
jgi:tyrosyl-tRNA synthetase